MLIWIKDLSYIKSEVSCKTGCICYHSHKKGGLSMYIGSSQVAIVVKSPTANAGDRRDTSLIPGSGRSPGGRQSNPVQYSCLENPMDTGAWQASP